MKNQEQKTDIFSPMTDLACERMSADTQIKGMTETRKSRDGVEIHTLEITSDEGAQCIGKPKGKYTTLYHTHGALMGSDYRSRLSNILCEVLKEMAGQMSEHPAVLVAALGNRHMTADSVGPICADMLEPTAHIKEHDNALFRRIAAGQLYVLTPGVSGQTGMEASEIVQKCAEAVRPELVIAIDALASRSTDRLAATLQICDTGISPGSGIGNKRLAISRETVGAKVIAIGVPTVVSTGTLVYDALNEAGDPDAATKAAAIDEGGFFVSPKNIDTVTRNMAKVISEAISRLWGIKKQ